MKIAYLIMAHKNPNQLKRLIKAIYCQDNYYLIHMDKMSNGDCFRMVRDLTLSYSNIYVMKSYNYRWGGYSSVDIELKAIRQLLKISEEWSFFINLSGQDFPLRSQKEIISYLSGKNQNNFIEYFDPIKRGCWNDGVLRVQRIYLEIPFTKRVIFLPGLRIDRSFLIKTTWYGGSQWFILSRQFCEYITHSREVIKYKLFFRNTKVPDESFFQTIAMGSSYRNTVINDNKRQINWQKGPMYPRTYTMEDYDELINSNAFFARKFDETVDNEVVNILEKRCYEN